MMVVYVAAASGEWGRARRVINELRGAGVNVPFDWTRHAEKQPGGNASVASPERMMFGRDQIRAVRACSDLLLLAPPTPGSTGAGVEYGIAFEASSRMHLAGPHAPSFFFDLATGALVYPTDEAAIAALIEINRLRRR